MPLVYKIDVLARLKECGYNTNQLRKEKLLSESTIQKIRNDEGISWSSIEMICQMLNCQPNDFLFFVRDCNGVHHHIEERKKNKKGGNIKEKATE